MSEENISTPATQTLHTNPSSSNGTSEQATPEVQRNGASASANGEAETIVVPDDSSPTITIEVSSDEPSTHDESSADKKKRQRRRKPKHAEGAENTAPDGEHPKSKKKHEPKPTHERAPFSVGEEVVGKVTKVMDEAIMVDISGKALGLVDRRELPTSEPLPIEGERFIGKVSNDGSRGGLVVLTHDLNRWQKFFQETEVAFANKQKVDGLVTGVIKGGVEVDVQGLRAFAPASHMDLQLGADLYYLIGQRFSFDIVKFSKGGREFILSRKTELEEAAKGLRSEALRTLTAGEIKTGIVRTIVPFGVFVDLGGVDGLIPAREFGVVSSEGTQDPEFKLGDSIEVKILRIDEREKVWLTRKVNENDPWIGAEVRYAKGARHKGKVTRFEQFGVFIELEPGIEGVLHNLDIVTSKKFKQLQDLFKVGDELDVVVAQLDSIHHKIGLHMAPKTDESSALGAGQRLSVHQSVQCSVEGHEPNGLHVHIMGQTGRHSRGYIPGSATGTPKGADLRKLFPIGKKLEAKITELDPRSGAKLSIKAFAHDQERQSFKQYQNQVKREAKFGTLGDLLNKKSLAK